MRRALGLMPLLLAACYTPAVASPSAPPSSTPPPIPTDLPAASLPATAAAAPTASPETFALELRRLTEPGCCVQPFWSADGERVLFIDRPQPTAPTGIYGVNLAGGEPVLVSERVALPSPDGAYQAYLRDDGETVVESVGSEDQWVIPNGGRRIFFSPGSLRLAWAETPRTGSNFDRQPTTVFISGIDGSDPQEMMTVYGGGIAGWLDDDHLLLVGRDRNGSQDVALFSLSVVDGSRANLITNQRIRSVQIAPGGSWVSYTITLHPEDPANDGLWVISRDGSRRYRLEVVGAAHWRDASRLLIIPFEPEAPSHRLWQFDAESGSVAPLTDPAVTPFRVAGGDWSVSPSGQYVVFVNAADQALWLIPLPPG